MPELPEIVVIAAQMTETLINKKIKDVSISQPKCLNRHETDYQTKLPGKKITEIISLGKWIQMCLSAKARLLINLGMGGELCYLKKNESPPPKTRIKITFTDNTGFYITFWWFGYFHLVLDDEKHSMTDTLGPDPFLLSESEFKELLHGRRGFIKSFLLNQKNLRGIGNFYIQEILFRARLHPLHPIPSLSVTKVKRLHKAIQTVFEESIHLGSSSYELDFFGKKGKYGLNNLSFAYREGSPCPRCGTRSRKLKTGSTTHYICPQCQKLP